MVFVDTRSWDAAPLQCQDGGIDLQFLSSIVLACLPNTTSGYRGYQVWVSREGWPLELCLSQHATAEAQRKSLYAQRRYHPNKPETSRACGAIQTGLRAGEPGLDTMVLKLNWHSVSPT